MPKCIVFVACREVIINQIDGLASLIGIAEKLTVNIPPGEEEVALDGALPIQMSVLIIWRLEPETIGNSYEQRVEILRPDGVNTGEGLMTFVSNGRAHRLVFNVEQIPVGIEGNVLLTVALREADSGQEWTVMAEYPIIIEWNRVTAEVPERQEELKQKKQVTKTTRTKKAK